MESSLLTYESDELEHTQDVNGLKPGELMFFHGVVAGSRGVCLVVSVIPDGTYSVRLNLLAKDFKFLVVDTDWREEGVRWDRLSERSWQ